MFKAKWKLGTADFDLIREIKTTVFVEERKLPESEVFDSRDYISAHLLITDGDTDEPIATARICPIGKNTHIGEIAVMPNHRETNYADLALRMMLYKAQTLSGAYITASVFEEELVMYESFGFEVLSEERGKFNVSVARDEVKWHSECKD